MTDVAIVLAILGVLTGLIAVYYLYRSSSQKMDYDSVIKSGTPAPPGMTQGEFDDLGISLTHQKFMLLSAKEAQKAAPWTAVSVILNGLSATIGFLQ